MRRIKDLPLLPDIHNIDSEIVNVFNTIRFKIQNSESWEEYSEFCWFIREYPRCYRYHLQCASYRLESIYNIYIKAHKYFLSEISQATENCFGFSRSDKETAIIYWEFDALLSSINTALDILARIVGTAYKEQTPPNFNKLCKKDFEGPINILKKAQKVWVKKMKDYRDCFIHYTPVDTMLGINADLYNDGWEVRAKLPVNPNVREILGFRYKRSVELLKYAISTYKHMLALDKALAKEIRKLYKKKEYPKKITNLFFLGAR